MRSLKRPKHLVYISRMTLSLVQAQVEMRRMMVLEEVGEELLSTISAQTWFFTTLLTSLLGMAEMEIMREKVGMEALLDQITLTQCNTTGDP